MDQENLEIIAAKLDAVANRPEIPSQQRRLCAKMRDHLRRPVRIVVTGLEGSGKSALINMMLARPVIDLAVAVPILDVVFGPAEKVTYELAGGAVKERMGLVADLAPPEGTVRITQELPDPTLRMQSYRELGLPDAGPDGAALLQSAIAEADFFIWCTADFGPPEQALWAVVPEAVQGHSLAVLTRADRLRMRDALQRTLAAIQTTIEGQFLSLYPLASVQALAALTSGEGYDEKLFRSSGGLALCRDIRRKIAAGRAEDVDRAGMILSRFEVDAEAVAPRPSAPSTNRRSTAAATSKAKRDVGAEQILSEAVRLLQRCGEDILRDFDAARGADDAVVLDRCVEAVSALTANLEAAVTDSLTLQDTRRDVSEGQDMLMLLQLERGEDAALDAVTLVLQLKKEVSSRIAA